MILIHEAGQSVRSSNDDWDLGVRTFVFLEKYKNI